MLPRRAEETKLTHCLLIRSLDSAAWIPHPPRQIEMTMTRQTARELPELPAGGFVMPVVGLVEVRVGYRRIVNNKTQRQEGPI